MNRFGVLPNFFRLAQDPQIMTNLWGFARFAYLDNPLPSLFKERLFVYLSRFCEVRYCIARHVGFLVGLGRPSGDAACAVQSIDEVLALIRRPLPRGEGLQPALAQCEACESPLVELPAPDSTMEQAIFACATHAFLQSPDAARCLHALRRALGEPQLQYLTVFLGFVRTAHYWTKTHDDLNIEEDISLLLKTHEALANCVLNDPEATSSVVSAYEALREADRRKDEFLAMLAHELRNPLAAIRNAVQILLRTDGDARDRPIGVRNPGPTGGAHGTAGGRPSRREPHQSGQDRASQRANGAGPGREPCRRSHPPASARAWVMN